MTAGTKFKFPKRPKDFEAFCKNRDAIYGTIPEQLIFIDSPERSSDILIVKCFDGVLWKIVAMVEVKVTPEESFIELREECLKDPLYLRLLEDYKEI